MSVADTFFTLGASPAGRGQGAGAGAGEQGGERVGVRCESAHPPIGPNGYRRTSSHWVSHAC